jgi:sodium/proline symporter
MDQTLIIGLTLVIYKLILLFIGWISRKKTINIEDYYLGGKKIGPLITAISYSASNSSAWTLLGVSGIAFSIGISTIWLVIGVISGMFFNWLKVAPSIFNLTRDKQIITVPQLLVRDYQEKEKKPILILCSIIIIFSFTFYIASQFQGAGNAFQNTFNLNMIESIAISAIIIYSYTYMGGYLAVSITDTIQGFLMAFTALIMPIIAINKLGGFSVLINKIITSSSEYSSLTMGNFGLMAIGLIIGNLGIALGYFGQPHLLSRFMSAKDASSLIRARHYTLIWFMIVFIGMWLLGLIGHFMIVDLNNNENIFFKMSEDLFNPVIQGLLIAAVISAIMSTADSQILVCSSSISLDLGLKLTQDSLRQSRLVTGLVILLAATIAVFLPEKIFSRVLFAWTAMGAAFGPAIISKLLKWEIKSQNLFIAILMGFIMAILFFYLPNSIGDWMERILPFTIGLVFVYLSKK